MSNMDPTAPEASGINVMDQELSVEDMAQVQAAEAAGLAVDVEEPTHNGQDPASADASVAQPVLPSITLRRRNVSGRYRLNGSVWQLELRVDVDGKRPMKRVSGDFYKVSGATTTYFGSFVVNSPTLTVTTTTVTITGVGQYNYSTGFPKLRVTIPRTFISQPAAAATAQFMTLTNTLGAKYICPFQSIYFRTAEYEQDRVASATLFNSYNTGSLPSGGPTRDLTVVKAYAEAGIEMVTTNGTNIVNMSVGSSWSNAELHAAMQTQFSLWQDVPNWKVWLFAANIHDMGSGLRGIMFDQQGKQRQGCAVFHDVIGGASLESQRAQLRTYVHELGHCFNLYHSFHKSAMVPPLPDRLDAKSWMNYVQNYPGGAAKYWLDFPFQFDDLEVIHLRHAYRNNILIGANNFGIGAALFEPMAFAETIEDNSGLELRLAARDSFALSEPVVVEISLSATDTRGKHVTTYLHPNMSFVQIGIRKPSGQIVQYEPLMDHCVTEETSVLSAETPPLQESAYIGYGKGGFYFDQSGLYEIRAVYHAPDGSHVFSNSLTLRVRHPVTNTEEEIADSYLKDDTGQLFYLLGSDSKFLQSGNNALDAVLDKHAKHPLATYARLVKGINAAREFKTISTNTGDKDVEVRAPRLDQSIDLLSTVVAASDPGAELDPISRDMVINRLVTAQEKAGDSQGARKTAALLSASACKERKDAKAAKAGRR
jgi:hypothetical protein